MRRTRLWLVAVALLLLWPAGLVWADEPDSGPGIYHWNFDDGKTFFGEDVTIESGETFVGPLGVFDGSLTINPSAIVTGDVFVSGGDVDIAGRIDGGLVVIGGKLVLQAGGWVTGDVFGMDSNQNVAGHVGGNLTGVLGETVLRSSAVVEGNLLGRSGHVVREPGAQLGGEELQSIPVPAWPFELEQDQTPSIPEVTPAVPELPQLPVWPEGVRDTPASRLGRLIGRMLSATLSSLLIVAVGVLVVVLWPRPTRQVSNCIAALPLHSLGLGLLTFLIAVGLEVLAVLLLAVVAVLSGLVMATVILLPVGLVLLLLGLLLLLPVPLALAGGLILGWVGLAELVGRKVLSALRVKDIKPIGAVFAGLALTVWLPALLSLSDWCCLIWPLVVVLLTSIGLGSVVLTRFGTRPCYSVSGRGGQPGAPVVPGGTSGPLPAEAMDQEAGQPDTPPSA